jgi:phosphatidylglycerol:prolipoprotein diacylglycerol transferase
MCAYYAPLRFLLDFLRERENMPVAGIVAGGDARYVGLTPAQWGCVPLLALGLYLLLFVAKRAGTELPPVPAALRRSSAKPEGAGGDAGAER